MAVGLFPHCRSFSLVGDVTRFPLTSSSGCSVRGLLARLMRQPWEMCTSPFPSRKFVITMTIPASFRVQLRDLVEQMDTISDKSNPTDADMARFSELENEFRSVQVLANRASLSEKMRTGQLSTEHGAHGEYDRAPRGAQSLAVRSDETMGQWAARSGVESRHDLSFGKIVRGLATGDWRDAEDEMRAISESPATAGGHLLPVPVALDVIQRARNEARVVQAGATIVPMTNATLKYPRLATEPVPSWRSENGAISDTNITFDAVTLTAQSLAVMVKCSWELLEDAAPQSRVIDDVFASAFALEIDRVALRGSGTAPEPRGVKNTSGVTVTAFGGANGAAPTDYSLLLDSVQTLYAANYTPTGIIAAPRTMTTLSKLREGGTTGAYLAAPASLATLPMYLTNQLPTNTTTGTSTDTSEVYVADWSKLLLGVRTQLRLRVLEERFADNGQVAFLADWRGDVQLAQPAAFNVITGVRP